MLQFDIPKYLTHASVGFLAFTAYDTLIESRDFRQFSLYDGGTYALSSVISLWASDLLCSAWGGSDTSLQCMLSKPLINAIVYLYLYDMIVKPNNEEIRNRTSTELLVMGSLGDVVLRYVENPLASLFGYKTF